MLTNSANETAWMKEAERVARGVRRRVLAHTLANNGGYLSQACSSAEMLAVLYTRVLRLGESVAPLEPRPFAGVPRAGDDSWFTGAGYNGPRAPELDRFVFSPVHYALVLYATLIEVGRLGEHALDEFNRDGSTVEMIGAEHSPGHELTAGSLGQAISQAGGIALARRLRGESGRTWVFMSDGEFQEGQSWEAFSALSYHRLDNLGVFVDVNGQQCDGAMSDVMSIDPLAERLRAFGAAVKEVDGHDLARLASAAESFVPGRPLVVLARTEPCCGFDLLERRRPRLHYVRFESDEERREYQRTLEAMEED